MDEFDKLNLSLKEKEVLKKSTIQNFVLRLLSARQ